MTNEFGKSPSLLGRTWNRLRPLDLEQHRAELITAIEALLDALLRKERGSAARRTAQIAAKLGTTSAVTSAMFGLATLFGTASTGTAIGSLSGAAFTSAALAWLGGSMWAGGILVFAVPLVAGAGAYISSKWAWQKWIVGKPIEHSDLGATEVKIIRGLDSLLVSLQQDETSKSLHESAYFTLWKKSLVPVLQYTETSLKDTYADWPWYARQRLSRSIRKLHKLRKSASGRLASNSSVPIGVFADTTMELLSDEVELTDSQELVVEAFRQQYPNELGDASTEEVARWLQELTQRGSSARDGALNAAKGKCHELLYVARENSDGDDWRAELILPSTYKGADVRLINERTGEVIEKQLKAENLSGIREHQREHPEIPIEATSEAAARTGVDSSGFSGTALASEVRSTAGIVENSESGLGIAEDALEAGFNAAFITLAINVGVSLSKSNPTGESIRGSIGKSRNAMKWAASTSLLSELFT